MRQRHIWLIGLICTFCLPLMGQKKMVYGNVQEVGQAKALYYYSLTDNELSRERYMSMVLQKGTEVSRFGAVSAYLRDSLAHALGGKPYDTRFLGRESAKIARRPDAEGDPGWTLIVGYPDGCRTITDRILIDYYLTEEKDTKPIWKLGSQQKTISGYKCMQASTLLFGRQWTVWYTMDIDESAGPWLLYGLPGVVVDAESDDGDFRFELSKMEHRPTPILLSKHMFNKVSRKQFLEQKQKYYGNTKSYVKGSSYGHEVSNLPNSSPKKYNPLRKSGLR